LNLVSVIVVTKNHSRYLSKCLNSILNQTYKNFEIIIIDHNSSDNTAAIINSHKSDKIKYFLYTETKGIAAVRNFGIERSNGEYVFFTDSDCMVAKNWIEEGMNILVKNEIAGVEGKTVAEHQNFGASDHFVENYNGGQYQTCNIAYKKKNLIDCGMFNEKYKIAYEDIDLAIRIKKNSSIVFNSDMLVFHQLVKWSIKGLILNSLRGKDKVMLVKEHKYDEILNYKILEINSLIVVLFPFLLLFYYRIKNLNDLYIIPFLYLRALIHRIVIWKSAIINKILIL
jgi:glycosyltransferase involved in cell wall biosynthesis